MDTGRRPSNSRGQLISPPNSGGSSGSGGMMNGGYPAGPRSVGGPSPPPSIGRSSTATNLYARSESGRSQRDENTELVLGEHYVALKRFLSQSSRDGKPNSQPNKARDKLQRLTSVQFLELSTDVYDELIRRQAFSRSQPNGNPDSGPPRYLLPEDTFHPKRNQARQKLSSLGPPRFRDLATDVFCELERRFPRFSAGDIPRVGSPMSVRTPSRAQTPVGSLGGGFPPRGQSRRRPSEAGSVRSMRSNMGPLGAYGGMPPSPGMPPGTFDRPLQQKQSQSNTIVPNKSTMVEEDDDPISPISEGIEDNFDMDMDRRLGGGGLGGGGRDDRDDRDNRGFRDNRDGRDDRDNRGFRDNRDNGPDRDYRDDSDYGNDRDRNRGGPQDRSPVQLEVRAPRLHNDRWLTGPQGDKRLMEDYEAQIRDLREQLGNMEDAMRKKDDEITSVLDGERNRATAANLEKKEWNDVRENLENQLVEARNLTDSLRDEMDRERDDHAAETRQLREQMEDLRRSADKSISGRGGGGGDPNLERENQELRTALREQQQVTDEVRREAEEFLREMRMLSQQSGSAFERQSEMEKTIESLEKEVRDWRNRYARTKTQLRSMRATSMGLNIDQDAGKAVRERGFTTENGMVKDVHVTKFQISIDELLRRARIEEPEKAIDSMKAVVVNVRRITKDIDESTPNDEALLQEQAKLKAKVSSTANSLITAAKNFGNSAGISPVSLLDAAASHLVAAVVELLRTVKIRATPAGELEDDDDGTMTPVDSTGFFSPRSNGQTTSTTVSTQDSLPPPRPFQGLGGAGNRGSADSSAYSPTSSPRQSVERYAPKGPASRSNGVNGNGAGYLGVNKGLPQAPNGNGFGGSRRGPDRRTEDLKV